MNAVIFDMDGVIIDSEPIHFYVDELVLKSIGVPATTSYLEKYVGMLDSEMWTSIIQEHQLHHTIEELMEQQLAKKIELLNEAELHPIRGIPNLIQMLVDNRIPIGLASSSRRPFIEQVLAKFNIRHAFDSIISGEEVHKEKPAPDIYIETAQALGVEANGCIVIEDSRNGVLAAKRAGMKCIGYRNPNSGMQDLSSADVIVDDLTEITLDLLKNV